MNFNQQTVNEQTAAAANSYPPPSSSGMDYFADQPLLRGYLGLSNIRNFNGYFPNPIDSSSNIQRKIEKERIREEIILNEIVRRRMFDEELRRELMLERHLALNGSDSFLSSSSMLSNHTSSSYLLQSETRSLEGLRSFEGLRSLEEMLAFSVEKRSKLLEVDKLEGSKSMQFQLGLEPKVSTLKLLPLEEGNKEIPKLMDNPTLNLSESKTPTGNLSGSKRKAESPDEPSSVPLSIGVDELATVSSSKKTPLSIDVNEPMPASSSKKSIPKNLRNYCSLCHVSATCAENLRQHLHGKKHKFNVVNSRQKEGKNCEIGFFPKTGADKK